MFQERLAGFEKYIKEGTLPAPAQRVLHADGAPVPAQSPEPSSNKVKMRTADHSACN